MYPILFSIGSVHIFSFSLLLIASWCVFSFLFWRKLRAEAIDEQHIFDLTFYGTIVSLVTARVGFVLTHWHLFSDNSLKIIALWVQPGLSLYAGLVFGMITVIAMSRGAKVRVGHVLDAIGLSLPWAMIIGKIGSLLDGSETGILTNVPWAVHYTGIVGPRHPVQAYEIIVLLFLGILMIFFEKRAKKMKWPFGLVGIWFFLLYASASFALEFFKDTTLYWNMLRANQWIVIGFFAEALGAFYVRGGGREKLRPFVTKIYAKFPKRHPK